MAEIQQLVDYLESSLQLDSQHPLAQNRRSRDISQHPSGFYERVSSALKSLSKEMLQSSHSENHAISALMFHSLPHLRRVIAESRKMNREFQVKILRNIDDILHEWRTQEHRLFDIASSSSAITLLKEFGCRVAQLCSEEDLELEQQDAKKHEICDSLSQRIKNIWPDWESDLQRFGSSANKLGFLGCDLDLVLTLKPALRILAHDSLASTDSTLTTDEIFEALATDCLSDGFSLVEKVSSARVPVLKLRHIANGRPTSYQFL